MAFCRHEHSNPSPHTVWEMQNADSVALFFLMDAGIEKIN